MEQENQIDVSMIPVESLGRDEEVTSIYTVS